MTFPFAAATGWCCTRTESPRPGTARAASTPSWSGVTAWADQRPDELVRRIGTDLRVHTGGPLADDMALIVLQGEGTPLPARISENQCPS